MLFLAWPIPGVVRDVVLGYDTWKDYESVSRTDNCYIGVTVGRYANRSVPRPPTQPAHYAHTQWTFQILTNPDQPKRPRLCLLPSSHPSSSRRIAHGRFTLDGRAYELDRNAAAGRHHLPGGAHGFDKRLWDSRAHGDRVTFQLRSEDGDGGYPGQLNATVTYRLSDDVGLTIEYVAVVEGAATVVNLVNHAYFSVSGLTAPIFGTELAVHADAYLATDADSIPTGELVPVGGTRFDFTTPRPLAPPGTTDATCVHARRPSDPRTRRTHFLENALTNDAAAARGAHP